MRPIKIRHDRICLKPFSIEWINYHSFSIVLVISGTFFCCYFVSDLIHGFWIGTGSPRFCYSAPALPSIRSNAGN